MSQKSIDYSDLDINAIVLPPKPGRLGLPRQRSRLRAALNLGIPFAITVAGLLWLAGVLP